MHVRGVQTWSRAAQARPVRVGKHGAQYSYTSPQKACGEKVEPVVRPAVDAFDLSDLGRPLSARTTRPKKATVGRLTAALRYLRTDATRRHHPGVPSRATDLRTAVLEYRNHCDAASGLEPLSTLSAQENHHALVAAPQGYRAGEPFSIGDLTYCVITGREQAAAQRFPAGSVLEGNGADVTRQAGNAVAVNTARWIGERLAGVL